MQAKLAHTPGPWDVQYQEGNKPYIVADQGRGWNNPVVCSLYEDVTPEDSVTLGAWLEAYENSQANARLIAAAPELLVALQIVLGKDACGALVLPHGDRARIENVIAKATGEKT